MNHSLDYTKVYNALIQKRKEHVLIYGKTIFGQIETHHIYPKSLGGSDDPENLINLTTREHYLAHWLLYKMWPDCKEMTVAFKFMSDTNKGKRRITSRVYANLKMKMSQILSDRMKGYYKNLTPEEYEKMVKSHSDVMKKYWKQMTTWYYEYWCWQHSYDLLNMSPEKLASRNEKWHATYDANSPEEKERIRQLKSAGSKKRWASMAKEEKMEYCDKLKGDNNPMRNMSDSEMLVFSLKVREGQSRKRQQMGEEAYRKQKYDSGVQLHNAMIEWFNSLTEEQKMIRRQNMSKAQQNMPEEIKVKRSKKLSASTKQQWANMTEDQRTEQGRRISEAKRIKFSAEDDEYIKTHNIKECKDHFHLSAKPILKRRKQLNVQRQSTKKTQ